MCLDHCACIYRNFFKCRFRNSDGWRDVLGRLFRTRSVMGRLWDDHFWDLGHPPKFYRVQDAGFIGGSSIWWQIIVILKQNRWKIIKHHVFSSKWHKQTKKPPAGKLATEVRSGDAPKPPFSIKSIEKSKKLRKSTPLTSRTKKPYFLVCMVEADQNLQLATRKGDSHKLDISVPSNGAIVEHLLRIVTLVVGRNEWVNRYVGKTNGIFQKTQKTEQ